MNLKTFSYRYAEEILEHEYFKDAKNELLDICSKCPLPVYKNKSKSQPKLDVVQQMINTYFKIAFSAAGWEEEPLATPKGNDDSLRGDFRKTFTKIIDHGEVKEITLQIEVEMGNIASSYRNYFKFQLSYAHNLANVAILILPCDKLSKRIDSGVASYEKTVREIPSANLSITVPILVIGLDDEGTPEIDISLLTTDMDVVKGAKIKDKEKHNNLVNSII